MIKLTMTSLSDIIISSGYQDLSVTLVVIMVFSFFDLCSFGSCDLPLECLISNKHSVYHGLHNQLSTFNAIIYVC